MTNKVNLPGNATELRSRAESIARGKAAQSSENLEVLSPEETRQMLHELRVHQIELEMQNEELRLAHAELDAVRTRYFDIYELAPVGYFILSEKGLILEANLTAATLLGVTRDELVKQPISRFIHKEDQDIYYLHNKQLFEAGTPQAYDLRMAKNDGAALWAHLATTVAKDSDGEPVIRVVMSNITERKHAELVLQQSEEKYRLLFHNINAAFSLHEIILDADGNPCDYRFLDVNPEFEKITGLIADEITGKTILQTLPESDYFWTDIYGKVATTGVPIHFENYSKELGKLYVVTACSPEPGKVATIFQDISDRNKAEEALRESEERFRTLSVLAPAGIYLCNAEGRCQYANPRWCEMAGLSLEEALGDGWIKGLHPEDRDLVLSNWRQMVASEGQWGLEYRFQTPAGKVTWVYGVATPQRDAMGNIVAYIGINSDMTERKQSEEDLKEVTQRLKLATSSAKLGIWDWDLTCNKMVWDNRMLELYCLSMETFPGGIEAWQNGLHPEDRDKTIEECQAALRGEKEWDTNFRVLHPDGTIKHIKANGMVILDSAGTPVRMLGINFDITERKRAEKDLLLHLTIMETVAEGIFLIGVDDNIIKWTNRKFEEMFGYGPGELVGMHVDKVNAPTDKTPTDTRISIVDLLLQNLEWHGEIKNIKKDGTQFWCYVHVSLFDHPEFGRIMVSAHSDITDRKRAEEQNAKLEVHLQQAQKMESIGSLAGGIAHDLNNILFPISGLSEMLLDDIPLDNPAHESIEQIHKSAMRGSELVKQILAFCRQSNPKKLPIRIQSVLKEALKLARATIPMNIEIKSDIKPECGMVSADPTQIHQIAMNLITNAFHAVEQTGGTINLELKETEFGRDDLYDNSIKAGRYACISISDTGTGIDQALMHKIFDPYFTTKELGKGTGLGLSVVHGISKEHGGDIRVYSEVGKGTAFHVYLPLLEDSKDSKTAAITRKYPTGCERILLVDDEGPILLMEQMMLERMGYQVTTRMSSPDALDAFRANPKKFDVVISDKGMPNMTGVQLARELISIRPDIPIIICTGFSDENDEQNAKAMGVKGFLKKPVATGDLAEMVRKVLDDTAESERVQGSGQADLITPTESQSKDQGNC